MRTWRLLSDYRSSLALENEMVLARSALACPFSSSDEFEAAIIAQRRVAGMYRTWRWPSIAGCTIVFALGVAFALL